ncbi:MAG TPA: cadmium-translocating P-type ATPase [Ruminococcus sp.]|nr:cadmium-translocating P-type ATPase [Ruminococcus sp.]
MFTFTLEGLDCPNCAAKIEREVGLLEGVSNVSVNLMQQMLTGKAGGMDEEALHEAVEQIVHKHEPDVTVRHHHHAAHEAHEVHAHEHAHTETKAAQKPDSDRIMWLRLIAGGVIFAIGFVLSLTAVPKAVSAGLLIAAYIVLGYDVVLHALKNIMRGRIFDEHFLMSVSTIGAFALGEFPEAAAVMLFYQTGEFFQSLAVKRSRKSVSALLDIRPDTANLMQDGWPVAVHPDTIAAGETILIKAGERVPLDGIVLTGESTLDTAALTGESVPRTVRQGDEVLSGCINESGTLTVRVTKPFGESTASRIIDMVENAAARKAPTENFITTFARYYTPIVVALAALLAIVPPLMLHGVWSEWIRRAFVFLIVSCPCALVISVPLTFFGGIGAASRHGVLVKGSNDLEALSRVRQLALDKTGTLTKGEFHVQKMIPADGFSESELLAYAACCEQNSNHPIAKSILFAYGEQPVQPASTEEISGYGIKAEADGKTVYAGSGRLMERHNIPYQHCEEAGTKVYVAVNGKYAGCIICADVLKPDSKKAVAALRKVGVEKLIMLTGDDERIAETVASELGMDAYYAGLLPAQKVERLEHISAAMAEGEKLAFVGDGINDAPVLARADVGIAMGALGADAAIEAADVVLMTDEPAKLAEAVVLARQTKHIVVQNIVFAIGVKILLLLLGALGIAGMWAAVFGDVGVTVIAVLNAMRMLRK